MRFLALLILVAAVGFGEDLTMNVVLPPDAKQAIASYDAAVAKAKADVIAKLQKAQETATKRGDLDGAMAIKARLGELASAAGTPIKVPTASIVGQWTAVWDRGTQGVNMARETWQINADGTIVNGPMGGKWRVKGTGVIELLWDQGIVDTIKDLGNNDRTTATRSNGKTVSMQKLP